MRGFFSIISVFVFLLVSVGTVSAEQVKDWTVAVYMSADNDLDPFGESDIREMMKVGSNENINLVVLRDYRGEDNHTKILYIKKNAVEEVKVFDSNIDTGDWKNLVSFFSFVKEKFPARRYLLDIWNHGDGWKNPAAPVVSPIKAIAMDFGSDSKITTPELGLALEEIKKINDGRNMDIIGMDACLMQMAEVIYEISGSTDIVVGSEPSEPGDGWAYDLFLEKLADQPQMSPERLSATMVEEYAKSYSGGSQGDKPATLSAVSTEKFMKSMKALDVFVSSVVNDYEELSEKVQKALLDTQNFEFMVGWFQSNIDHRDLVHFLKMLDVELTDQKIKSELKAAMDGLSASVISTKHAGEKYMFASGIAVWIPSKISYSMDKSLYEKLKWSQDLSWDSFIEMMYR